MSRKATGRLLAPWSLFALGLAVTVPGTAAQAQDYKTTYVTFASGSATRNGYLHGRITLRYRFDSCGDRPQLFYTLEPGSAQGYEGYWYEGKMYGLKSSWSPAAAPLLDAEIRVRFNARPIPVSPLHDPYVSPISCMSGPQYRMLGKWSDYTSPTMTREQALTRFDFDVAMTREPMRSPSLEAAIRAEISAAKQQAQKDSLEKARLARAEQARKDSIARAPQVKANTTGTTTGAVTTTGTGVLPVTGNAGQGTTTQNAPQTEAERRAEEQRDADARARAIVAQLEAEQAAREAQSRQVEAATQQVAGMVGNILEERRREQERKAEREFAAYERQQAYVSRVLKVYAALPARPRCTTGDTLAALSVGQQASGVMIGSECRLADSSSAYLYPLHIAKKQKVEINATGTFNTQLKVSMYGDASNLRLMASPDTGMYNASKVEGELAPGDYYIVVQTRQPGESGTYTVQVAKGEMSRTTRWSLGMYLGPVSGDFTGVSEEPQFGNVGGFRGMAAINKALHLQAVWGTADGETYLTYWDVGARLYLGNRTQTFRPVLDVLYGGREMFADKGISGTFYKGTGMSYGGGVEWFLAPQLGLELIYAQVGGTLDIDEPQSGYSPTIDYSHGALRLGFMFHR